MLLSQHLHVNILVIVSVERGDGIRVPEPEVYCVGCGLECDFGEGDGGGDGGEEGAVFGAEIVVLGLEVAGWYCARIRKKVG